MDEAVYVEQMYNDLLARTNASKSFTGAANESLFYEGLDSPFIIAMTEYSKSYTIKRRGYMEDLVYELNKVGEKDLFLPKDFSLKKLHQTRQQEIEHAIKGMIRRASAKKVVEAFDELIFGLSDEQVNLSALANLKTDGMKSVMFMLLRVVVAGVMGQEDMDKIAGLVDFLYLKEGFTQVNSIGNKAKLIIKKIETVSTITRAEQPELMPLIIPDKMVRPGNRKTNAREMKKLMNEFYDLEPKTFSKRCYENLMKLKEVSATFVFLQLVALGRFRKVMKPFYGYMINYIFK